MGRLVPGRSVIARAHVCSAVTATSTLKLCLEVLLLWSKKNIMESCQCFKNRSVAAAAATRGKYSGTGLHSPHDLRQIWYLGCGGGEGTGVTPTAT